MYTEQPGFEGFDARSKLQLADARKQSLFAALEREQSFA